MEIFSLKFIMKIIKNLIALKLHINYKIALHKPFYWATNLFNILYFTFIAYSVGILVFWIFPLNLGIHIILLLGFLISPFFLLLYLHNSFKKKSKNEVLTFNGSFYKLIWNNIMFIVVSMTIFFISIQLINYKWTSSYSNTESKKIIEYNKNIDNLIFQFGDTLIKKNLLQNNENKTKKVILDTINSKSFKDKYISLYKTFEKDIQLFYNEYYFVIKDSIWDIDKKEKIEKIKSTINNLLTIRNIIDILNNSYKNDLFYISLFCILILSIISNISSINFGEFLLIMMFSFFMIIPYAIMRENIYLSCLLISFYLTWKYMNIQEKYKDIICYLLYFFFISIYIFSFIYLDKFHTDLLQEYRLLINLSIIVLLSLLVFLYYKFYFKIRMLSPMIIDSSKKEYFHFNVK